MSLEHFHLLVFGKIVDSVLKREYIKIYHQQGAQLNNRDQNKEIKVAKKTTIIKIKIVYLQYAVTT